MRRKTIVTIIAILFSIYVLLLALLYLKQDSMVYFPPNLTTVSMLLIRNFTHQEVTTEDGLAIKGYFTPPAEGKPVILEFHGNGSHPAWEASKFPNLIAKGYGFFLAEYRGYGGNPGHPTERSLYKDADAYLKWIRNNPALKDHPLIIYGASIGSGVAVDLASRNPDIAGLVLETPFDTLPNVARVHYPRVPFQGKLMRNKYDNISKIKNIKTPVLIMLARHDTVTPIRLGQALADAANEPKTVHIFEDASHVDVYEDGAEKILEIFLNEKITR